MNIYNLSEEQLKLIISNAWDLGHSCEAKTFKESVDQRISDLFTAFPWLYNIPKELITTAEIPHKPHDPECSHT